MSLLIINITNMHGFAIYKRLQSSTEEDYIKNELLAVCQDEYSANSLKERVIEDSIKRGLIDSPEQDYIVSGEGSDEPQLKRLPVFYTEMYGLIKFPKPLQDEDFFPSQTYTPKESQTQ